MNTEPALRLDGDEIEDQIIDELLDRALGRGWRISVHDGEDWALRASRDKAAIRDAMRSTDENQLHFTGEDGIYRGVIVLIYGNGEDLISDSSFTGPICALCDQVHAKFEAHHG